MDNIFHKYWEEGRIADYIKYLHENCKNEEPIPIDPKLQNEIDSLKKNRELARSIKNFAKSDEIREKLRGLGVEVEDRINGSIYTLTRRLKCQ